MAYKTNFYFNFFEKRVVPDIYKTIVLKSKSRSLHHQAPSAIKEGRNSYIVELFPTYLDFEVADSYDYTLERVFRVKGYAISLNGLQGVDDYLKKYRSSNFRTIIRRKLKGLESCFNVQFKMIYGQITLDEYTFLMQTLKNMLVKRFDQRNDVSMALSNWDQRLSNTYDLIIDKKASLFVIYDGKKPIQISLSYHYDKILFLSVPSYDIEYSKFGLGNLAVHKLLEWGVKQGYEILDMGFGAFDYKVKWCNYTYDLEHHLFYKKSSLSARLGVRFYAFRTVVLNFLLDKKINLYYHRLTSLFKGAKKTDLKEFTLEMVEYDSFDRSIGRKINPLNDANYAFARNALYDFAYKSLDPVTEIEMFETDDNNIFYLKGSKLLQKLIYRA